MFCKDCGFELKENAVFCSNCGAKIRENDNSLNKVEKDNTVLIELHPKYNFIYQGLPNFIMYLPVALILGVVVYLLIDNEYWWIFAAGVLFFVVIVLLIREVFRKKEYDNTCLKFYKTKVFYKYHFLKVEEKEINYNYIVEAKVKQTFIQRMFNLGTIVFYTSANIGYENGIYVTNIENVKEVYKKIKEIIGL